MSNMYEKYAVAQKAERGCKTIKCSFELGVHLRMTTRYSLYIFKYLCTCLHRWTKLQRHFYQSTLGWCQ